MGLRSPLAAIRDWIREQDGEIRSDIAVSMAYLLLGPEFYLERPERQLEALLLWLDDEDDGFKIRAVGRALMFKSCFEFFAHDRFSEGGWRGTEAMFRDVVSKAASDPQSEVQMIAPGAFRALRDLPARRENWALAGKSWAHLVEEHLTHEALNRWSFQPTDRPEPPTIVIE